MKIVAAVPEIAAVLVRKSATTALTMIATVPWIAKTTTAQPFFHVNVWSRIRPARAATIAVQVVAKKVCVDSR
jgi:hypothetical protein